jgi:hypothetical protein
MGKHCERGVRKWRVVSLLKDCFPLLAAFGFMTAFVPSAARAECGDYVIVGAVAGRDQSHPVPAQSGHLPSKNSAPHTPCRGPYCSSGAPIVPPPVTVLPLTPEQWGCVSAWAFFRHFLSSGRIVDEPPQEPRLFAQGIYHPPRSGCSLYLYS